MTQRNLISAKTLQNPPYTYIFFPDCLPGEFIFLQKSLMTGSVQPFRARQALISRRTREARKGCSRKPLTFGSRLYESVTSVHRYNSSLSPRNKVTGYSTGRKWQPFLSMACCCSSPFYPFLSLLRLPSSPGITRSWTNRSVGDANWH